MATAANALENAAADLKAGRHGSAERKLKGFLKLRPRDPTARHLLGLVHLARGRADPAVRQLRLALKEGAGTDAEVNLGLALIAGERYAEAERILRAAVVKDPNHSGAAFNLGHLLRLAGNPGEAAAVLRRVLDLEEHRVAACLELGLALMETGAFDEARDCLASVLARDPDNEVAVFNAARIDQRLGRFQAAADAYRSLHEAGASGPEISPEISMGLAACLQELGRSEEALTLYRELLEHEPSLYPEILRSLTGASSGVLTIRPSAMRALLTGPQRL